MILAVSESLCHLVNRLLHESQLGKIMQKAVQAGGNASEIVDWYLHDFVHMSYRTQSEFADEEFQVG